MSKTGAVIGRVAALYSGIWSHRPTLLLSLVILIRHFRPDRTPVDLSREHRTLRNERIAFFRGKLRCVLNFPSPDLEIANALSSGAN